jgi:hypothetical protein
MTRFWTLMHRERLVLSWGTIRFLKRATVSPKFSLGPINGPAMFNNFDTAKEAAQVISKKTGDPCYVLESVAIEVCE